MNEAAMSHVWWLKLCEQKQSQEGSGGSGGGAYPPKQDLMKAK